MVGAHGPAPGIPRSQRFAGSRPLRFAKGARPPLSFGHFPREQGQPCPLASLGIPPGGRFANRPYIASRSPCEGEVT